MAFIDALSPVRMRTTALPDMSDAPLPVAPPKVDRHTDLLAFTTLRAQHMERVASAARYMGFIVGISRAMECVAHYDGHTSEAYKDLKILLDSADERTVPIEPDERQRLRFEQRVARKVRAVQDAATAAWRDQEWFVAVLAGGAFVLGVIVGWTGSPL